MKETYGLQCFEIDLDLSWSPLDDTDYNATSEMFAFYNENLDVRLSIAGFRIDATGRDLFDLATGMLDAVLKGIASALEDLDGSLLVNGEMAVGDTETGFDVDVTAEVAGAPLYQRHMFVATIVNSVVAINVRMESSLIMAEDLRTLWRNVRPDLFLVEPVPPGG